MTALHGVIVVDKPAGMTSAAVVSRVKAALRARRAGHTGTLDPMATGVLPVCLGEGTKIAGHLLAEDKAYEAELELGVETDTLDAEGEVLRRDPDAAAAVSEAALRQALHAFIGPGEQVPPMYSAIKHRGKRLHELARAGEVVELAPRPIVIHALALQVFAPPRARFSMRCSKGTYVRSLARDLGARLGCGACLTGLRRVQSGAFTLAQAMPLADIEEESAARRLVSPAAALAHLPAVTVPHDLVQRVASGQRLPFTAVAGETASAPPPAGGTLRLLLPGGELLALARVEQGSLRYERVFTYGLT